MRAKFACVDCGYDLDLEHVRDVARFAAVCSSLCTAIAARWSGVRRRLPAESLSRQVSIALEDALDVVRELSVNGDTEGIMRTIGTLCAGRDSTGTDWTYGTMLDLMCASTLVESEFGRLVANCCAVGISPGTPVIWKNMGKDDDADADYEEWSAVRAIVLGRLKAADKMLSVVAGGDFASEVSARADRILEWWRVGTKGFGDYPGVREVSDDLEETLYRAREVCGEAQAERSVSDLVRGFQVGDVRPDRGPVYASMVGPVGSFIWNCLSDLIGAYVD